MLTDWHLGLAVFGKLSFSFSLINFALTSSGSSLWWRSLVLKRLGEEGKREKYLGDRARCCTASYLRCTLGYAPVLLILGWWLPEYRESLAYLGLVLPVCVYSCKANILFSTYLKMSRDEGLLCAVNVATMVANARPICHCDSGNWSVGAASVGIVASLAARDFAFERIMAGRYGEPYVRGLRPGGGYFGCVHGGVVVLGRLEQCCLWRLHLPRSGGSRGARRRRWREALLSAAKGERL